MTASAYASIIAATLFVLLVPGPIMATIMGNALAGGLSAGVHAAIGVVIGETILLVVLAASMDLAQERMPALVPLAALLGGVYLVWLGCAALWSTWQRHALPKTRRDGSAFSSGVAIAVSSPSGVAFYAALVMPFVEAGQSIGWQLCWLGSFYLAIGIPFHLLCAFIAGWLGERSRHSVADRLLSFGCGMIYAATGVVAIKTSFALVQI